MRQSCKPCAPAYSSALLASSPAPTTPVSSGQTSPPRISSSSPCPTPGSSRRHAPSPRTPGGGTSRSTWMPSAPDAPASSPPHRSRPDSSPTRSETERHQPRPCPAVVVHSSRRTHYLDPAGSLDLTQAAPVLLNVLLNERMLPR